MKLTPVDIAFVLESIAHLNDDPAIRKYAAHILVAALLVRGCTEEQLAEALKKQQSSIFYGGNLDVPQPVGLFRQPS